MFFSWEMRSKEVIVTVEKNNGIDSTYRKINKILKNTATFPPKLLDEKAYLYNNIAVLYNEIPNNT